MARLYGTHNSATGGRLVWWQRPFSWLINLTSRCQRRSIEEQLRDGVRLFNLQITKYGGDWHFSHGTAIYEGKILDTLERLHAYATAEEPVYFQLFLDDNWFTGQPCEEFRRLAAELASALQSGYVRMLYAHIENSSEYPYKGDCPVSVEERYWTRTWVRANARSLLDRLPLPERHARRYNSRYKAGRTTDFLMLDFYEQG